MLLFNKIFPYGIVQLVKGPTRFFPGQTPSGLDHIYTNIPDKISHVQKFHCGGSDHNIILAVRSSKSIRNSPEYIRKRCYRNFDPQLFIKSVRQTNWLDLYLSTDVNRAVYILTSNITNILNVMAPMKTFQLKKNYNPWISKCTLDMMKERDKLHKIAGQNGTNENWTK